MALSAGSKSSCIPRLVLRLEGQRVFFKRQGKALLRSYWCCRFDEPAIRAALELPYTPKYHIEEECLDGLYLRLRGSPLLWYKGLFTLGRHLPSGKFIQAPLPYPLAGLAPRELVWPERILGALEGLTLIGDWRRYQKAAEGWLSPTRPLRPYEPFHMGKTAGQRPERLVLRSGSLRLETPAPLLLSWGRLERVFKRPVICLRGQAENTILSGFWIAVPVSEILWKGLPAI